MYYRMLGGTGLQVSILSYGFWATFGVKQGLTAEEGVARAKELLHLARQAGINLFDNAETYGDPQGEAETIMGEAIAQLRAEHPVLWHRSETLITTKIFWAGPGVNQKGLSRKHIREGLDAALARLQVDYVDLVFCHRPDPFTPTETVVRAMTDMVRSGRATAWGTSEWSAQQITEAVWIARTQGLEAPQFEQPQYHMLHRERFEREYAPLFREPYTLGTTTWSPLASGILTGKYNEGVPEGSRLDLPQYSWLRDAILQDADFPNKVAKVQKLTAIAEELGATMAQLALAWTAHHPHVSTVITGASRTSQVVENMKAIEFIDRLTPDVMARIEAILDNKPAADQDFRDG